MAPSFETLREADLDDDDFDEDEVDISDLRDKYEVQLEQGFDSFVVVDGLPEVNEEQKPKLAKFLLKKLSQVGKTKEELIEMPMGPRWQVDEVREPTALWGRVAVWLTRALPDSPSSSIRPLQRRQRPSGNSTWSLSTSGTRSV